MVRIIQPLIRCFVFNWATARAASRILFQIFFPPADMADMAEMK